MFTCNVNMTTPFQNFLLSFLLIYVLHGTNGNSTVTSRATRLTYGLPYILVHVGTVGDWRELLALWGCGGWVHGG